MTAQEAEIELNTLGESLSITGRAREAFNMAVRAIRLHSKIIEDVSETYLDALDDYPQNFSVGFCEGVKYCLCIVDDNLEGEQD